MTDRDDSRLNDYLDGELGDAARRRIDEDIRSDVGLRARLRELEQLRDHLSALPLSATPPDGVWAGIEAQIREDAESEDSAQVLSLVSTSTDSPRALDPGRRVSFSIPQLAAAALVLLSLGALGSWVATGSAPGMDEMTVDGQPAGAARAASAELSPLAPDGLVLQYETSIAELSAILEAGQGVLSPETLQVVRESLASIDAAVEEALVALDEDPSNDVARRILQLNLDKKVDLLQRTAEAVQEIAD
ncbi:MAG: hypothetical protein HKO53_04365 [Gemmatimonadetes bacterium]|nr:hypothetical protein [Gemmatimonadota bacterium]